MIHNSKHTHLLVGKAISRTILPSRIMERQYNTIIHGGRWLKCTQVLRLGLLLLLEDTKDTSNEEE